ncbi:MAG: ribonuclease P protein component [Micavibrio aeruginosavorus]|uniref:Ribonuclease P protein component n=1 Tax=Micavibrio aeruginosavorus TaxID=349221 RepID=A0A7T5R2T4_9BACT|nr:MAG: ribonuclease P protein component [Micavibrio aeruginosavorus]
MNKATKKDIEQLRSLRKRGDFLRVQGSGCKWVAPGVIMITAPGQGGQTGFGLTVTKKLSKSAVIRNRIRRRLRSAAYDVLPRFARSGQDYILIARLESGTIDYEKLCKDIYWCLKRLECLNETNPHVA